MIKVILGIFLLLVTSVGCGQVKDVQGFISSDNTHNLKLYNCAYYTSESMARAKAQGLDPYVVILYFDLTKTANLYSSHVLLVFDTNEGLVFYDPQQGREVKVAVGLNYWFPSGEYPIQQYIVIGKN